ncbi:MAG TPA: hypothetical protein ENI23_05555 [bacterium]|nr:hypothetical protein [bacterium]
MANYNYVATKRSGERVKGVIEAGTREEVVDVLHEKDLIVVKVTGQFGLSFKNLGSFQIGGVPLKDKVFFAKQLSTMLAAGLPIIQALEILVQQTENQSLKKKLQSIYDDVQGGNKLSSAFSKHESMFNKVQLSLLKAGEESGNLSEIITQIATDLEKSKTIPEASSTKEY